MVLGHPPVALFSTHHRNLWSGAESLQSSYKDIGPVGFGFEVSGSTSQASRKHKKEHAKYDRAAHHYFRGWNLRSKEEAFP